MSDDTPVQRNYRPIAKPLYPEVKQYVEDLLNRRWIQKSKSAYSSPVVCVRQKNGTLRLCIDYRELNRRTVTDRHPLPRVLLFSPRPGQCLPPGLYAPRRPIQDRFSYPRGAVRVGSNALRPQECARGVSAVYGGRTLSGTRRRDACHRLWLKKLNTENNYHLHSGKLEYLALKWSICEQFRDYLYYVKSFTVYTDNNPLVYTDVRAIHSKYMRSCTVETSQETIRASISGIQAQEEDKIAWITAPVHDGDETHFPKLVPELGGLKKLEPSDIVFVQTEDPSIGRVRQFKLQNCYPKGE